MLDWLTSPPASPTGTNWVERAGSKLQEGTSNVPRNAHSPAPGTSLPSLRTTATHDRGGEDGERRCPWRCWQRPQQAGGDGGP